MRRAIPVLVAALTLFGAAACGSDSKNSSGQSATTTAPEEHRATAAEVSNGLKQLETTVAGVAAAAGSDKAKAKSLTEQIEPVWKKIEGTIKANDQDTYVRFEDNFALLEKAADSGDAAKAQQAAGEVSKAVAGYLSKYPG
jgi:predicted small lipoprotein YifL